ncbi:MAG: hypothetical protein QOE66_1298, partial [Chloroflexota bacterium]|nr:hypothetical protein [Chloroflexota bacterium]
PGARREVGAVVAIGGGLPGGQAITV